MSGMAIKVGVINGFVIGTREMAFGVTIPWGDDWRVMNILLPPMLVLT